MKHTYKDVEGSRREFVVDIPPEAVKAKLDKIYEEMKHTADIPGFRKGKIPKDVLERYHGKTAREKAFSDLISDSYREIVKQSNTMPVGLPAISDVKFKEKEGLSYKATVDIRPEVDLKRYKNIKVTKKSIEIKDEDVSKYLSALQESYAEYKSAQERPARLGDNLVCDIICEVDGKPIQKEQKNIWLYLDKGHPIPELVDGLIGIKTGETRLLKAILPAEAHESHASGSAKAKEKEALFKIKANQIKEKHLPEINDEFVKNLGTYENVSQLREAIKKDLKRKQENKTRVDMEDQVLEELLKNSRFLPPKGLVDEERERMVQELKEDLQKKNIKKEDIEKRINEAEKGLEREAVKRVRLYFILAKIAKIENIDVKDSEVDEMLGLLAQQTNASKEEIKKYYSDNNLLLPLKNQLKESKTIDFLINNAEIKEEK